VDEAAREEFLLEPRVAVLSTVGPLGTVHSVPVWFVWDGIAFRVIVGRGSQKHRNVQRTGRATLCIDHRERMQYRYVTAEGPVTVIDIVTDDMRRNLWRHYLGDGAEKAMEASGTDASKNVCLVLMPERWISPDRV
jgi:PPOX class probable F420-dependent enzyme